ncbi:MAG: NAD-binding protein, partial [Deltaproteobacteria bacterium]|nr:NAD-binding protein [Deltaproteobacteria bacterium]
MFSRLGRLKAGPWRRFWKGPTWRIVLAVVLIFSLTGVGILLFEYGVNQGFQNLGDVVWWTVVTASTVGYGDTVPQTTGGRIIAVLVIIFGVALVSVATGRIASWLIEWKIKEGSGLASQKKLNRHLVICGWKNEMPKLLQQILKVNEALTSEDIVLVSTVEPNEVENLRHSPELKGIRFVRGDFVDEAVLHRANIKKAFKVLVLADSSIRVSAREVDSRTVMAVMSIKSISKDIYTCVELVDAKFERYLQSVHCEEVFLARKHNRILLASASRASGVSHIIRDILDIDRHRLATTEFPTRFVGDTFASLSQYYMEAERSILIGVLENTGNIYQRKKDALRQAQKTTDISRLVANLQEVKRLRGNEPVFNPGPDYQIKPYSRAIL